MGSIAITFHLGLQRFNHERELADVADARSILAEAAVELHRATESLNLLRHYLEPTPMYRDEDSENAGELITSAAERGRNLETQLAAVRVRFKFSDPVAKSLAEALDAMLGLVNRYDRRHRGRKDTASLEKREDLVHELGRQLPIRALAFAR